MVWTELCNGTHYFQRLREPPPPSVMNTSRFWGRWRTNHTVDLWALDIQTHTNTHTVRHTETNTDTHTPAHTHIHNQWTQPVDTKVLIRLLCALSHTPTIKVKKVKMSIYIARFMHQAPLTRIRHWNWPARPLFRSPLSLQTQPWAVTQ